MGVVRSDHAGGGLGIMDSEFHDRDLDDGPNRRDAGTRSVWLRAARSAFAVFCLVVASLAGTAAGRLSPVPVGATHDTIPRADAQRDAGRNLLRPQAEIAVQGPIWRFVGAGGPQPDPHPSADLNCSQSVAWLERDEAGFAASVDRGPQGLTVRAGYSRAPPTVIGRSRTAA